MFGQNRPGDLWDRIDDPAKCGSGTTEFHMIDAEYVSPDGLLHFTVETADNGVVCLGFPDCLWHQHAHGLSNAWGVSEQQAIERYVKEFLENRLVIAVTRIEGKINCVNVTDDPASETLHLPPGMTVELRYWDCTQGPLLEQR